MHPKNQPDQTRQQQLQNQAAQPADPEHANAITVNQWRTVYWEKPTDNGIRDYQARLHQDL